MEELPNEILINIISKLDVASTLNCTLVCKRFSNLVNENSVLLLKEIVIPIDLRNVNWNEMVQHRGVNASDLSIEAVLNTKRKYQNFEIFSYSSDKIFKFIEKFGNHLKSLEFRGSINQSDFIRLLESIPHLETGDFNVDVYKDENPGSKSSDYSKICKNLKNLKCEGEIDFFLEVFSHSVHKLKEFELNGHKVFDDYNVEMLKKFLFKQKDLKILKLHFLYAIMLFSTDLTTSINFQLEFLEVKDLVVSSQESRINYIKFLAAQTQLNRISILSTDWNTTEPELQDDLMECLLKMENLEVVEIDLNRCEFMSPSFSSVNPTIKKFTLKSLDPDAENFEDTMMLEKLVNAMPGLRTFKLATALTASHNDLNCLNNLLHLSNLTVRDCYMNSIKSLQLPNLRKIKLCAYDDDEEIECDVGECDQDWILFFKRHPLVSEFIFNSEFSEFVLENIFIYFKEIQHLELTISTLESAQKILKNYQMCCNLKFIQIIVEPPKCSKYLRHVEEFRTLFGIHGFSAKRCGIYTDYIEFTKTL